MPVPAEAADMSGQPKQKRCRAIDGPRARGRGGSGASMSAWKRWLWWEAYKGDHIAAMVYFFGW